MTANALPRAPVVLAVRDTVAISRRNLRRLGRAPNLLLLSLTTGVLFVLLFRYVFGGTIRAPGISYVDYLMPGAFILTVTASAVTTTGVGFAEDLASGAIDRWCREGRGHRRGVIGIGDQLVARVGAGGLFPGGAPARLRATPLARLLIRPGTAGSRSCRAWSWGARSRPRLPRAGPRIR